MSGNQPSPNIDLIRYEVCWLIGMFSIYLLSSGADPKVTRAAVATFGVYAGIIIMGTLIAWFKQPDAPQEAQEI